MKSLFRFIKIIPLCMVVAMLASCGGAEDRKASYLKKGKAYLAEENYDKARIEFKNVLQIDPKYAEAYFYMGQLEEKNKELGKALARYRKAIELNKKYTEAKIQMAKIYALAGTEKHISEAKKLLQEVKLEDSSNPEAELTTAIIEYKVGDKVKAVSDLEVVVRNNVNLVEGVALLSGIYVAEGKDLKAESLLIKGVENNKKDVLLRISLAKLLTKNKRYDLAEKHLKEAISIDPDEYSLKVTLGVFYSMLNKLDKAEDIFRQAIRDDDEDVKRYMVLVDFLASKISREKAIEELKLIVKKKPDLYGVQFAMADFYLKTGQVSNAKSVIENIISKKEYGPEGIKARNKLADISLSEGNVLDAKKYINIVLEEHPNNNDALLIGAKLDLMNFDAVSAINSLRTVVKNEPKNLNASLMLARAHKMNKEPLLAENELKKAIEINPTNYMTHINYAKYLMAMNRQSEALDVVEKALVYFKDNYDLLDFKLNLVSGKNDDAQIVSIIDTMKGGSPDKYEVYMKKGKYYLSRGKFKEAIEEFDEALLKTNNKYPVLEQIVRVSFLQKNAEQAISRLKSRLEKNASDAASLLLLGQIYLTQKDVPLAKTYIENAISNSKNWIAPYDILVSMLIAENKLDKAIDVYNKALDSFTEKKPVYLKMAALYEKDKNYKMAINTYKKLLEINPGNKIAQNNVASLLLDHGSSEDIKEAMDLVVDFVNISNVLFQDTLGWAYAKSGNNLKAIEIFSSVVNKTPKIAVFQYHLGVALFNNGEKDKARAHLQMSVDSEQQFFGKEDAKKLLNSY